MNSFFENFWDVELHRELFLKEVEKWNSYFEEKGRGEPLRNLVLIAVNETNPKLFDLGHRFVIQSAGYDGHGQTIVGRDIGNSLGLSFDAGYKKVSRK